MMHGKAGHAVVGRRGVVVVGQQKQTATSKNKAGRKKEPGEAEGEKKLRC